MGGCQGKKGKGRGTLWVKGSADGLAVRMITCVALPTRAKRRRCGLVAAKDDDEDDDDRVSEAPSLLCLCRR